MARHIEQYQDMISRIYANHPLALAHKQLTHNITFQVTDACNLKCTYCYQINKGHHVMSMDVAKRFIDMILDPDPDTAEYIDSRNSIAVIIEFIGGEPFLEIDLIDEITDYFIQQLILRDHPWQYHYMISICSNGVLYFDPKVQAYMKKHFDHLSFSISIDGNKELHDSCRVFPDGRGSYDIAMAGVKHWTEVLGRTMGSKMTLAPANIKYTKDAVISLIESGYDDINLNCVFEKGWTEEHATIFYHQLVELANYLFEHDLEDVVDLSIFVETFFCPSRPDKEDTWCGGYGKMISVDYKGDIYPCIRYMESSLGTDAPPVIIGNVYDGIMHCQEHKDCVHCMRAVTRLTEFSEECLHCPIEEGCAECAAYNYQEAGGKWNQRATYICIMHKARALANCYYWNMKYWKHGDLKRFKLWLPDEEALKIITPKELEELKALQFPIE